MDPPEEPDQPAAGRVGRPRLQAAGGAQQQSQDQEVLGGCAPHHGEFVFRKQFIAHSADFREKFEIFEIGRLTSG